MQLNWKTIKWEGVARRSHMFHGPCKTDGKFRKEGKGQVETRPGLLGEIRPQFKTTSRLIYFLAVGGGGASLVCAQAPSPKALAITTAIMITFKNFNLYRLLSQQVAPVCLDREQPRGNAFLNFFETCHNRALHLF